MSRKPIKRKSKIITLDDSIIELLLNGHAQKGTPSEQFYKGHFFSDFKDVLKNIWSQHKKLLLEKWTQQNKSGAPWIEKILKGEMRTYD